MELIAGVLGAFIVFVILWDAFETMVLPRRVTQQLRLARLFYRATWVPWAASSRMMGDDKRRESFLSYYGPLSLILLLGVWALGLVLGFALLHWALGHSLGAPDGTADFATALYFSGTTFFTLGLGDLAPQTTWGRALTVVEAGIGFAFLGGVVGYLPTLNQSFSRRETSVSLLDARAGSPPSAVELIRRNSFGDDLAGLSHLLHDWERWSAEVLEGHLSYPVLGYFRSHHDRQAWVTALTMILDSCSLLILSTDTAVSRQAQLTYAMARHTALDLSQIFGTPPRPLKADRLPPDALALVRGTLKTIGVTLQEGEDADRRLAILRAGYEPYVNALSRYLRMPLPPWLPLADVPDNWLLGSIEPPTDAGSGPLTSR